MKKPEDFFNGHDIPPGNRDIRPAETDYFNVELPDADYQEWDHGGGTWMGQNGGIDDSLFPHRFVIDCVRVYEFVYPGQHLLEIAGVPGGKILKSRPG
ncbi:MAG: hypothetical protein JW874_11685 [Spirochaetales bacterium]|nr:hypothetical protein [Spirochaetales bacterium]